MVLAVLVLSSAFHARNQPSVRLSRCWSYAEPILRAGGIAADDSAVYLVDKDNRVKALDRVDGNVIWTSELGGVVDTSLVSTGPSVLVLTRTVASGSETTTFYFRAISKATGITQWITSLSKAERYSIRSADGSVVIIEDGAVITAVDVAKGRTRWTRHGIVIGDFDANAESGSVATISASGKIEVLSLADGKLVDSFKRSSNPTAFSSNSGQTFVFGDARGMIEGRRAGGTLLWTYKAGGAISGLVIAGDNILAASNDNFLYSISLRNGDVEWKRKLPGRISSVDLMGAGQAGVTVVGETTAYVIEVTEGRFLEQLVLSGDEEFIGYPLRGDHTFLAALTSRGLTTFSADCANEKAAVNPAAL